MKKIILILSCFLLIISVVSAQKKMNDTTVTIVKQFQPTIADAYKINEMPVVKDSVPPAPNLSYAISSKKVFTPFTVETLKSAKMVGEPLNKLYNGLVKIGGGNYNGLYGELFWNNGRSKDFSYGTYLKHFSSSANMEGFGYGGQSDDQIELYGKKFYHHHTLSGNIDYNRNMIHYYGYTPDTGNVLMNAIDMKQATKQIYSTIGANASLQSHYSDTTHLNYLLKLKGYNLSDSYKTSESNVSASADFSGYYQKQSIHVPVAIDYYDNKSVKDTSTSTIISLLPYVNASGKNWKVNLGAGLFLEGNKNDKSRFFIYPNVDFNYCVVDNILVAYTGTTGGLKKNSLQSLLNENPFLVPGAAIKNSFSKQALFPEMYIGLRGSISKTISYNARTSYNQINDMHFFVNDNSDTYKKGFNIAYYDVKIWNLHGELQYQYSEKIKFLAKGDYNKYTMPADTIYAWHRPAMQLTFSANYNLKNKIVVNADVFVIGKRFAEDILSNSAVSGTVIKELPSIVDANLGIEYRNLPILNNRFSAFIKLNNLGFSRYYLWNNYPSYKFNFLAGISAAF